MNPRQLLCFSSIALALLAPIGASRTASAAGLGITDTIAPTTDLILPFGALAIGKSSAAHTVTVTNPDPAKTITVPPLQFLGSDPSFILDPNGGSTPCGTGKILLSLESCTFTVTFKPSTPGSHSALLSISLDLGEERIAFHDPDTNGISFYGLTSKETTQVTHPTGAIDLNPSWSPGQGQIVFHRKGTTDTILRVNIDSTGETLVANFGRTPAWSPDGQRIAFQGIPNDEVVQVDLNLNTLVEFGATGAGAGFNPHYSPNGKKLVFARDALSAGFKREITTSDLLGKLDVPGPKGETPSWSTKQLIAFQADSTKGISTFDPVGFFGQIKPLTIPSLSTDKNPSWNPDGTQIVFHRATSAPAKDELFTIVSSGNPTPVFLTNGKTPEWSPSSKVSISFLGTGLAASTNSPPSAPQLLSPKEGAIDIDGNSVAFKWLSSSDPDGDPITYDLLLCKSADFPNTTIAGCERMPGVQSSQKPMTSAGIWLSGGSLLFGMVFSGHRHLRRSAPRRSILSGLFLLIMTVILLNACGGGGGGGNNPINPGGGTTSVELSHTVTGLAARTSFTWQVIAKDGKGGETRSLARTFTTA